MDKKQENIFPNYIEKRRKQCLRILYRYQAILIAYTYSGSLRYFIKRRVNNNLIELLDFYIKSGWKMRCDCYTNLKLFSCQYHVAMRRVYSLKLHIVIWHGYLLNGMVNIFTIVKNKVEQLIATRLRVLQLAAFEKIAVITSLVVFSIIVIFTLFSILLFLGLALGEYFACIVKSQNLGYLIATGIFITLVILMVLLKRMILSFWGNKFVDILSSDRKRFGRTDITRL